MKVLNLKKRASGIQHSEFRNMFSEAVDARAIPGARRLKRMSLAKTKDIFSDYVLE